MIDYNKMLTLRIERERLMKPYLKVLDTESTLLHRYLSDISFGKMYLSIISSFKAESHNQIHSFTGVVRC